MSSKRTVPSDAYPAGGSASVARCARCGAEFEPHGRFCPFDGSPLQHGPAVNAQEWWPIDGRYAFEAVIGEGRSGIVYRVRHVRLGRRFALKVLPREPAADAAQAQRLMTEVRAIAAISHPTVCEVNDFGRLPDGRLYLVMELLPGKELGWWMRRQPNWTWQQVMHVAEGVASALAAMHTAGVVHRDLKPSNVRIAAPLGAGGVKVTVDAGSAAHGAVDFRTDVEAFGALLRCLLERWHAAGEAARAATSGTRAAPALVERDARGQVEALAAACDAGASGSAAESASSHPDGQALLRALRQLPRSASASGAPRSGDAKGPPVPPALADDAGSTRAAPTPSAPRQGSASPEAEARLHQTPTLHRAAMPDAAMLDAAMPDAAMMDAAMMDATDFRFGRPPGRAWLLAGLAGVGLLVGALAWNGVVSEGADAPAPPLTLAPSRATSAPHATDLSQRALPTTSGAPDVSLHEAGPEATLGSGAPMVPQRASGAPPAVEPSRGRSLPSRKRKRQPVGAKRDTNEKATVDAKPKLPQRAGSSSGVDLGEGDIIDPWSQR